MSFENKSIRAYWSRFFILSLVILLVACSTSSPTIVTNTPLNTNTYTIIPSTATQTLTPTYDFNAMGQSVETFSAKRTQDAAIIEAKTPSPTLWPTLIPSPTATPTPTAFVETYPVKQVWIEYGLGGNVAALLIHSIAFLPIHFLRLSYTLTTR